MTDSTFNPFQLPLRRRGFARLLEWVLGLRPLISHYRHRPLAASSEAFLQFTLSVLGVTLDVDGEDALNNMPRTGPLLIVANHPLGGLEGVAIAQQIMQRRPDIKVLANQLLCRIPELKDIFIGVDVLSRGASKKNFSGILQANRHLQSGGALLIFPASKVSTINLRRRRIEDVSWHRLAGQLLLRHYASCLPVYVRGRNSWLFYLLGLIHPRLRTLCLARELANKQGTTLKLVFGETIDHEELHSLGDSQAVTDYLRMSTDVLATKRVPATQAALLNRFKPFRSRPESGDAVEHAIAEISDCIVVPHAQFPVYCAPYGRMPLLMNEIGRAREVTFRLAGEGTGKDIDVDIFDPHYLHIFIWDAEQRKVVGGYRIGKVDEIIARHGLEGLYSRSLYRFDQSFIKGVGPALEVGRSFVHPDYQRQPLMLDLLWRGIGAYVARNLDYHVLFGAVSISREHSDMARQLIADCMLERFPAEQKYLQQVKPLTPFKIAQRIWSNDMLAVLSNIKVLNKLIGRCDPGKTIPTLLRHYLSLNGRFVCFTLNTGFNDSLDGLMMVDLRATPKKYLQRYLGKVAAERFIARWTRETACES